MSDSVRYQPGSILLTTGFTSPGVFDDEKEEFLPLDPEFGPSAIEVTKWLLEDAARRDKLLWVAFSWLDTHSPGWERFSIALPQ